MSAPFICWFGKKHKTKRQQRNWCRATGNCPDQYFGSLKKGSSNSQLFIQDSLQEIDFPAWGLTGEMQESSEQKHKNMVFTERPTRNGTSWETAWKQQQWLFCKSWPRQKEISFLQPNFGSVLAINVTPADKWCCWRHRVAKVVIPKCLGRELGEFRVPLVKYFSFQLNIPFIALK